VIESMNFKIPRKTSSVCLHEGQTGGVMRLMTDFQVSLFEKFRDSAEPFDSAVGKLFSEYANHPTVFSDVLYLLSNIQVSNSQAQVYFNRVDQHRRHLESMMGHQVDTRVALMDYFINVQPKYRNPKIVELSDFEASVARAATDSLTGLFNRSYFNEVSQSEFSRSLRYGYNLSIVYIDIDHFKEVNDRYGHVAGDQVLVCMAQYLKARIRHEDFAFRFGGEEFVLLLPQTGSLGLQKTMNRLIDDMSDLRTCDDISVTFSAGTAVFPHDGKSIEALLDVADKRMYRAKAAGRNQAVFSD